MSFLKTRHLFQITSGIPFGPGADELRQDRKTAEKSANEGGLVEVVKEVGGGGGGHPSFGVGDIWNHASGQSTQSRNIL